MLIPAFFLPVLFWVLTKKGYHGAQEGKQYKRELYKMKYNKEVFSTLLQKQKAVTVPASGLGIVVGNPDAQHTLVKVCNPYCGPCAKAHKIIEELIHTKDVRVQIIFTASDDGNDIKALPVKHLMAIYKKGDPELIRRALDDWYNASVKDYETFKAKYPLSEDDLEKEGGQLTAMRTWCDGADISFTPTFFVDGHQLPNLYTVKDLKHLF